MPPEVPDTVPPDTDSEPPPPLDPDPTPTLTAPPWPPEDAPLDTDTDPLDCANEDPDRTDTPPLPVHPSEEPQFSKSGFPNPKRAFPFTSAAPRPDAEEICTVPEEPSSLDPDVTIA